MTDHTNTPINKYQDLTRLALNSTQVELKANWDTATAELCKVNTGISVLMNIKRTRKLKQKEREELAFLNGQHELLKKQFDSAAGAYATAIEDDLRNHILHYTITALEYAGLPGYIDYNSPKGGYYSDVYFYPCVGSASVKVSIGLDYKTGTLSEIQVSTERDSTGNYHSFRINRNYRHKNVHEYALGTWSVSTSCLQLNSEDSQEVIVALKWACRIADGLERKIPGDTAIRYIAHGCEIDEFEKYEKHLEERAKRESTGE